MQQTTVQSNLKSQNAPEVWGIIILPEDPFYIGSEIFYEKKLCGISILDRNINILKRNRIKNIYIISKDSKSLSHFVKKNHYNSVVIKNYQKLKEDLKEKQYIDSIIKYGIIMDGSILIDDRVISGLLKYEEEIIYRRGKEIQINDPDDTQHLILAGKINLLKNSHLFHNNYISFKDLFDMCSIKNELFHSTDEINSYRSDMRRNLVLYVHLFRSDKDFKTAKKILVDRTQKGTLDLIAWNFNRHFENFFVKLFANTKITANHCTYFVNILAYLAVFLFLTLNWWIGLFLLVIINIFDGVDGKLARLREKESKVGHIEHSFDQLYEQAIYVSIGLGAFFILNRFFIIIVILLLLLSDSFNRHCSMQYKEVMGITLADSSKLDQNFRRFDGRRNIYTIHILIWGILGHFEFAIFSICVHAFITSIIYSIQAIRHMKNNNFYENEIETKV
ncbi:MAG: CDP-alcohol phosphatidyltransferase family protein [Promethearchaeota archaeon]